MYFLRQLVKFTALFTSTAIFLWILPLGAFIKPSQEKMACDGQRAFHMCSMQSSPDAQNSQRAEQASFTNASGVDKDQKSSNGSGGNDFIAAQEQMAIPDRQLFMAQLQNFSPRNIYFSPLEAVPKV